MKRQCIQEQVHVARDHMEIHHSQEHVYSSHNIYHFILQSLAKFKRVIIVARGHVGKKALSCIVGGSVSCYNLSGNQAVDIC